MSKDNKQSIFDKFKTNKKFQIIVFSIFICIVIAIFIIDLLPKSSNSNTTETLQESYVYSLEKRLSDTLSKVSGAGKVSVVITVESGMETVLAMKTETIENGNGKQVIETPILVNGKTVTIKEKYPKITGVLIVAEGAENISVLTKIQQATVSLLDININQIEILSMK